MNNQQYMVPQTHTIEALTKAGTSRYNLTDADSLRGKKIIGAFIRQQNAAVNRKSKNGHLLISNELLAKAYLFLEVNGKRSINEHPLEHYVFEPGVSGFPGSYVQLNIPKGFDPSTSYVRFSDGTNIIDDRSIQITFIVEDDVNC